MEIKWEEYINEKRIKILNLLILIIGILVYEILYCNSVYLEQKNAGYQFSLFRVVIYIVIVILACNDNKNKKKEADSFHNIIKQKAVAITIILGSSIIIGMIAAMLFMKYYIKSLPVILLAILSMQYFIINITKSYTRNSILIILCLGFVCAIGSPFNNIIDEKRHFLSAYNIAMGNWDYHNPIIQEEFQLMEKSIRVSEFSKYFGIKYLENEETEEYQEDITNTPATYSQLTYIPSAIGIQIAKSFDGSVADMYIAGRITNCIFYAILIGIALNIIPFKKRLLYVIATMPTIICFSASYSVDAIAMGVITIFIAYCLKLCSQETISKRQVLALILIFFAVLQIKSMGYIAVSFILLILPLKKLFVENKKTVIKGVLMIAILQIILILATGIISDNTQADPRMEGTNVSEQIQFMTSKPLQFTKVILESLVSYLTRYDVLYRIHEREFFTNANTYIMFLFILMYTIYVSVIDNEKNLNRKEKIIFITAFILQILLILVTMYITYTPVGASKLEGYHSRYLFPILMLPLSCFSNRNITLNQKEDTVVISTAIVMGIFMFISILGMITMI